MRPRGGVYTCWGGGGWGVRGGQEGRRELWGGGATASQTQALAAGRKFPGRARPRRAVVEAARGEGCRSRASRLLPHLSALGRRGSARREAGKHRWLAAAAKLGGGGCCECERRRRARGHTECYRGCGRVRAPRLSGQVRGASARTAPALRARAASATVPASPPRHGATVSGARTPRAGL